ncbi:phage major capsid protein [Falsigemmobacter faecalis]|uniref:Uncharacterized protein n=1 Tax=Falsigemmobacter faecalis TaxID=2488730 RepID=A0A3P3D1M8_9RHOB|nr:Mu-like prophage major head subunit gpT family protein [Falsigemmobacter faecalis]RRH68329.1 hypothetical protein EG244_19590 [Falsigemmobacter faecalis]
MPLDFRMKHVGEPPARLIAQLRLRLRENGHPPMFAEVLAPVMETEDDLDTDVLNQITALVQMLQREGVSGEEAMDAIREAVADLMKSDGSEEDADESLNAWFQAARGPDPRKGLLRMVQDKIRASRPKIHINGKAPMGRDLPLLSAGHNAHNIRAALTDALLGRIDRRHKPTVGERYASMTLGEMAAVSAKAAGHRIGGTMDAIRMASHTTSDFPQVLGGALEASIARHMEQITPALQRAAHEISAENYRPGNLLSLSSSGVPQEIPESGEIKHVTIDERGERKPAPRDYGAMFRLSNHAMVNDNLDMFSQISQQMVAGAMERYRRVLLSPLLENNGLGHLMADHKPVFHADHNNIAAAGSELTVTSLSAARLALRTQKGSQGEFYGVEPWALVVPPQLETTAQQLLAQINATKTADVNPFSGALELIVEAGLTDPKAWYLIGDPAKTDGLAYSFLEGQQGPQVETKPGWDTLGMEFRLVWALDARFVSYASWYKNPGVAP